MRITINNKLYEVGNDSTVFDALNTARINPETVLVKRKGKLIPHDSTVKDGDSLELITVISGG